MAEWQRRRFWKDATVQDGPQGHAVLLDGRPLHTPAKTPLLLPSPASAGGVARVWPRGPALTTRRWCCRPVACGAPDRALAGGQGA